MKQTTIAKKIEGVGIGLHKGEPIKIILEPLEKDMGIVFYRSDLGTSFRAEPKNVINTQMATVVGNEKGYVSTIEHLLGAINGYGIDNIRIVLDANEVPVMDGSAISFCMMLDEAGIKELDGDKKVLVIKKDVEIKEGDKYVKVSPSKNPKFNYTIKFENPVIGKQSYTFEFSKQNFINEIARARTFGFLKDVQKLNAMGLALGGSLDNAVVIDDTHILNPEGLRFEDEFVRHKILDAIGDISLLGAPMVGDYEAYAGSHDLNHKLTKAILADEKNYEIVTIKEGLKEPEYAKAFA
ncbi:UDP-3-O-[3-hydroxymyristoyl] N-acetylglucosamine deacetylase [Campylobacter hyointestinalis]|uniref:UDP-3-O-acyl-N-acetylglucosamine deacetylase n=1 Tax=Campylobacter hyointestinalis subsp. hyointestinalis TaxID=91352 RepID=A0A9W5EW43_CAMHY|nr:UDP-3-O-acyl-N-acetylglucosamine deacetylase [Campylobacter hyointestinalis]CUU69732.1 UDP-3-O-[3-hydroxymyristoyl] N-acetylglucosamine deacetylase [Campylobacter hyointestinalis subsp. hyointestinalis]CUU80850.1 UDP-3-O-[3-hydroxymyristoyl] N-acetylglucosamine deacetylase [Campylobacter hyointestinalis]CUU86423.1 UDP-3-O-[3-hydroxymyristoyl] N-acetylglucosamine deacetylase [Campylobacter hyointestinalis subsp. hyointestinalis]CUU89642.1 UDP-3-O-[3-hydroxymyristoyl] N-acetylglucosamine deace